MNNSTSRMNVLEREFFPKAQAFIDGLKAGKDKDAALPLAMIEPGTDEWNAWVFYFHSVYDLEPATMRMVRAGQLNSLTMPARWPEWFDPAYRGPEAVPPDPLLRKREPPSPEEKARIVARMDHLMSRHRSNKRV